MPPKRDVVARFFEKIQIDANGCWLWTASLTTNGYARFTFPNGKHRCGYGHRWSYEHFVAPIPEGMETDHLCGVRRCVNWAHLEPVPTKVNQARGKRASATQCKNGHPWNEANTGRRQDGTRYCRACGRAREAARKRRLRETMEDVR